MDSRFTYRDYCYKIKLENNIYIYLILIHNGSKTIDFFFVSYDKLNFTIIRMNILFEYTDHKYKGVNKIECTAFLCETTFNRSLYLCSVPSLSFYFSEHVTVKFELKW